METLLVPIVIFPRKVNAHDVSTHAGHLVLHRLSCRGKLALPLVDAAGAIETFPLVALLVRQDHCDGLGQGRLLRHHDDALHLHSAIFYYIRLLYYSSG